MSNLNMQMFSLRYLPFEETIRQLADVGYSGVELFSTDIISAQETKKITRSYNMTVVGVHTPLNELENSLQQQFKVNDVLENEYIICPVLEYGDKEHIDKVVKKISRIGKDCSRNGFRLLLHNHQQEFEYIGEKYIIDYLLENIQEDNMGLELDCFWMYQAGVDVLGYIEKVKDRCPLVHLKNCKEKGELSNISLGKGCINMKEIINRFPKKTYIYEREVDHLEPWNNIVEAYDFYEKVMKEIK